jgi:RNA polymerase sigma factor (sigma-70 family)
VSLPPFQRFLDTHAPHVQRFLVAAVGPVDADDCFQETFLSALRAYPRLRHSTNLRAWVLTIAHRKAIDSHRGRARRATPTDDVPERPMSEATGGDPALWAAVRELPPKQRDAVLLRYVNDLSHADIGTVLGCSEEAARRSVHEGVKKLRAAGPGGGPSVAAGPGGGPSVEKGSR